jgi:hypothetical protein
MLRSNITTNIKNLFGIMGFCLIIGVGCVAAPTPSQPTAPKPTTAQPTSEPTAEPPKTSPTPTPTRIVPTPTSLPTETSLPPTDEPDVEVLEIVVPAGNEATIDGVLSTEEWERALQIDLDDENQLLLMHASGYLYIGMRGKPESATNICVDQGDQVSILHSSAALGTAVYQLGDGVWERVRDFEWCCRHTTDSTQAQEVLDTHLQEEGWVANNAFRGVPEEIEYQIAMPDDSLRLSVNTIQPPSYRTVLSWPKGLEDDCSRLGPIPEEAQFSPEGWVTLSVTQE